MEIEMANVEKVRRAAGATALKFNEQMDMRGKLAALDKVQAIIELGLDCSFLTANENFLKTLGYDLAEIQGQHHRMFCDPAFVASLDYRRFWEKLNRGEFDSGEYRRLGKNGKEVWIQASYNPIFD